MPRGNASWPNPRCLVSVSAQTSGAASPARLRGAVWCGEHQQMLCVPSSARLPWGCPVCPSHGGMRCSPLCLRCHPAGDSLLPSSSAELPTSQGHRLLKGVGCDAGLPSATWPLCSQVIPVHVSRNWLVRRAGRRWLAGDPRILDFERP